MLFPWLGCSEGFSAGALLVWGCLVGARPDPTGRRLGGAIPHAVRRFRRRPHLRTRDPVQRLAVERWHPAAPLSPPTPRPA